MHVLFNESNVGVDSYDEEVDELKKMMSRTSIQSTSKDNKSLESSQNDVETASKEGEKPSKDDEIIPRNWKHNAAIATLTERGHPGFARAEQTWQRSSALPLPWLGCASSPEPGDPPRPVAAASAAAAAASVNYGYLDLLGLSRASEVSLRTAAPWTTSATFSEALATLPVRRCRPSESRPPPRALGAAAPACRPSQALAATPEPWPPLLSPAASFLLLRPLGNPPLTSPTCPAAAGAAAALEPEPDLVRAWQHIDSFVVCFDLGDRGSALYALASGFGQGTGLFLPVFVLSISA
uniref:Uncharacterized protein n=1 Tax=Ananas comosus var. bracteatus TaxID=296719 RepID=A0A6V7PS68_ANACO|nr:unnamed protein product [Ananas comosus var. bracteatus]